jgi:transposase
MAKELLADELWAVLEPLMPPPPPRPKGGRRRVPNRATRTGILFVLQSGIPWELLPRRGAVAVGGPVGGACRNGRRLACGTKCPSA